MHAIRVVEDLHAALVSAALLRCPASQLPLSRFVAGSNWPITPPSKMPLPGCHADQPLLQTAQLAAHYRALARAAKDRLRCLRSLPSTAGGEPPNAIAPCDHLHRWRRRATYACDERVRDEFPPARLSQVRRETASVAAMLAGMWAEASKSAACTNSSRACSA